MKAHAGATVKELDCLSLFLQLWMRNNSRIMKALLSITRRNITIVFKIKHKIAWISRNTLKIRILAFEMPQKLRIISFKYLIQTLTMQNLIAKQITLLKQIKNQQKINKKSVENKSNQYQESKEKSQSYQKSSKVRVRVDQSTKRVKQVRKNSILNMKLLTKIKQNISQFNQKYTLSGRTSLLNQQIRAHIEDLSDGYVKLKSNIFNN
ncbi:hypothetical protein ABPG72_017311 [Tetrahymena utriculariae]